MNAALRFLQLSRALSIVNCGYLELGLWGILVARVNVRFTPKSGHRSARWQCPLSAKSGPYAVAIV
jgi:hypothetical protein